MERNKAEYVRKDESDRDKGRFLDKKMWKEVNIRRRAMS